MDLFLQALRVVVMQIGKPLHLRLVVFYHAVDFGAMAVRQFNDHGFQIGDLVRAHLLQVGDTGFIRGRAFGSWAYIGGPQGAECATGSGRDGGLGSSRFSMMSSYRTSDAVMPART